MTYYYAQQGKPVGPLGEDAFIEALRRGVIEGGTPVFRAGEAGWNAFSEVAAPWGIPVQRCASCGSLHLEEDSILFSGDAVCAGCKEGFFGRLKEGLLLPHRLHYAGFGIRFAAFVIEQIAYALVGFALQMATALVFFGTIAAVSARPGSSDPQVSWIFLKTGVDMLGSIAISWFFTCYCTVRWGGSPGKLALGLRVVRPDGSRLGWGRATGRYFAHWLSAMSLYLGYILAAFDGQRRALHDHVADTRVVHRKP